MNWGLIFFARVGSIFPRPSSLQTGLAWLPRAMACASSLAGPEWLVNIPLELCPQGIFTCLSSISTCGLCLVQMPGWAPVPWQVPRSDKSTANPRVRLPPDLGHPRLPARPSFPVLAKLGAWPSGCPRCLGTATAHWAQIAVPCLGHAVLPGVGSAACLRKGAPFRGVSRWLSEPVGCWQI